MYAYGGLFSTILSTWNKVFQSNPILDELWFSLWVVRWPKINESVRIKEKASWYFS